MVLGVAEGLARGHHDRVPGVHPQGVEVLHVAGSNMHDHAAGGAAISSGMGARSARKDFDGVTGEKNKVGYKRDRG